MKKRIILLGLILAFSFVLKAYAANEYWQTLDGPYWVNGVDVAYGPRDVDNDHPWYRYIIGSDESDRRPFYWSHMDNVWRGWNDLDPLLAANKMITYKLDGYGQIAFLSAYNDRIWKTIDGGGSWNWLPGSDQLPNKHFSSIEVPSASNNAENVVMVAALGAPNQPSTYFTEDGSTWNPIGGASSPPDLDVYDIESFSQAVYPPTLAIGTNNGIYFHSGAWSSSWGNPIQFNGDIIPVLETIDRWHLGTFPGRQIAAREIDDQHNCNLYQSMDDVDPWSHYESIWIHGQEFHKRVRDIAAIHWGTDTDNDVSCYVATDQGIFLISYGDYGPDEAEYVDLNYPAFAYDQDVQAVDYRFGEFGSADTAYVLVATKTNLYEIKEARINPSDPPHISVSEIVTGTYLSNVASAAFPSNSSSNRSIFSISDIGLVKEHSGLSTWNFVGKAFEGNLTGYTGTDIATKFTEEADYILASSNDSQGEGRIMRSDDGGVTWSDYTPGPIMNSAINSVGFDPLSHEPADDYVYAAGTNSSIWYANPIGDPWIAAGSFTNSVFRDIFADPNRQRDNFVYDCGSGNVKVAFSTNNGADWNLLQDGLGGVSDFNELAKSYNNGGDLYPVDGLYAATNQGVYKYDFGVVWPSWEVRSYGINTPNLGSIVVDRDNPYALLTSTAPGEIPPHIWASGDSGRSWIDLPLDQIPQDASINRLACSQTEDGGFIAATSKGIFYIDDIFQRGIISNSPSNVITWGPGVIIVNGDVTIAHTNTLRIVGPCTVYFTYNFDGDYEDGEDTDASRSRLRVWGQSNLEIDGTAGKVILTSSKPSGKSTSDWTGIIYNNASSVSINNCDIEYCQKGIYSEATSETALKISNCTFSNMQTAGIDILKSTFPDVAAIKNSLFNNCGSYGIRVRQDDDPSLNSLEIEKNEFVNANYGIWYSGNADGAGARKVKIYDNIIRRFMLGGYDGIYAARSLSTGLPPIIDIQSDSITYFSQAGVLLSNVSSTSNMQYIKVKHNGTYGVRLVGSSPTIGTAWVAPISAICFNQIGISCDKPSNPFIRGVKIKRNSVGGVQIESRSGPTMPDFGNQSILGYNSINYDGTPQPPGYYDMKNFSPSAVVMARGNWWGGVTDFGPILGPVDYNSALTSDPMPGLERRDPGFGRLPDQVDLLQNYPNPFNPSTQISFYLTQTGFSNLKVYNVTGQLVKTLVSDNLDSGEHEVIWDGKNSMGADVASGIYFYVLSTEQGRVSKSMTLLR
jgi:photosystem II stability/assembly factor-like uncharacterized protein